MPQENRNQIVGIAMVVCGVVWALVFLAFAFLPSALPTIERISGYVVILGILLGFLQYTLDREASEKAVILPLKRKR